MLDKKKNNLISFLSLFSFSKKPSAFQRYLAHKAPTGLWKYLIFSYTGILNFSKKSRKDIIATTGLPRNHFHLQHVCSVIPFII